jgi:hypothetical protein
MPSFNKFCVIKINKKIYLTGYLSFGQHENRKHPYIKQKLY